MICQAVKRVLQMSVEAKTGDRYFFPLGVVRCSLSEHHDGFHEGEHPTVKGPQFHWPRGKQAEPAFIVRPKA